MCDGRQCPGKTPPGEVDRSVVTWSPCAGADPRPPVMDSSKESSLSLSLSLCLLSEVIAVTVLSLCVCVYYCRTYYKDVCGTWDSGVRCLTVTRASGGPLKLSAGCSPPESEVIVEAPRYSYNAGRARGGESGRGTGEDMCC